MNYAQQTLQKLIDGIMWFDLPNRLKEIFKKLNTISNDTISTIATLDTRITNIEDTPPSQGVQSISGDYVDNTDPANPLIGNPTTYELPYKIYTALLAQIGTATPTAIELDNTLGEIQIIRDGVGAYRFFSSDNLFTQDKVFFPYFSINYTGRNVFLPIVESGGIYGYYTIYKLDDDPQVIYFKTYDSLLLAKEFSNLFANGNLALEFKVYN